MIRAAIALAIGGALAAPARAEVVALPSTKAVIDVPPRWQPVEADGVVLARRGPAGELLAVTRARIPNPDAWRAKTREAYAAEIERGIAGRIRGYQRRSRKLADVGGVPSLDVEASRDDGATLVIRVLLFRRYALAVALEVPRGVRTREARAIAASFAVAPTSRRLTP